MKKVLYTLQKITLVILAICLAQFTFAQSQTVDIIVEGGSFPGEIGFQLVDNANAVQACGATGSISAGTNSIAATLPEGIPLEIWAYDSWGDGWNGGSLDVQVGGVSLIGGPVTLASGGGSSVTCGATLAPGGNLIGSFTLQASACEITCPDAIEVDNDLDLCGADLSIPLPEVGDLCNGAPVTSSAETGSVPFLFNATGIINTPSTLSGAINSIADVSLDIVVTGDFGAGFEVFALQGPDGSTVISQGGATPGDCNTGNLSATVAQATWNGWVATYGANLTFTALADPDVDDICVSSNYSLTANMVTAFEPAINDYNNTADASDFYGVGTTTVTFTTFDAGGLPVTCSFDVTVNDAQGPIFNPCPEDIEVFLDPGLCTSIVNYEVDAEDNCPPQSDAFNQNLAFPTAVDIAFVCSTASPDEISYYRVFDLPALGISSNRNLSSVNLGVWHMDAGSEMYLDIYALSGADNTPQLSELSPLGSAVYVAPVAHDAEIVNMPVGISVPAGTRLVIEARSAGTTAIGASVGFDLAGESAPSYVYGCNTSLPGFFGDITNLDGFSARGLVLEINLETSGATIAQTDGSGLTSGDEFPIGVTDQEYTATDDNGLTSQCAFTVTINEYANPTATLACNDNVNISLPESGTATVGADAVLEGGPYGCYDDYVVTLDGGSNQIDCSDVGHTLEAMVFDPETGNSCWGYIFVEDKIDPQIECEDFSVSCTFDLDDLEDGLVLDGEASQSLGAQPSFDASSQSFNFEFNQGASATVTDVTMALDISHTWVSDLSVTLQSPSGTSALLFAGQCGADDDVNATFNDAGAPLTCGGTPTISGDLAPAQPFAAFLGEPLSGTWTLTISDNFGADPTNINSLSLSLGYSATYSAPAVTEACDYELSYEDIYTAGDCTGDAASVLRTYIVTDASGNSASCVQTITILRPTLADVEVPPSYDGFEAPALDCSGNDWDTNGNGYPDVEETGFPTIDGEGFENGDICGLSSTYEDLVIDICEGSFKVRREWILLDWCTGEEVEYNQLIKVLDTNGPEILNCPTSGLEIAANSGGPDCTASIYIQPLDVAADDCSSNDEAQYTTELWTLGAGTLLEVIDGNGGFFHDVALQDGGEAAQYTIRHRFFDSCGNESFCLYDIIVIDEIVPVAICDEITDLALSSNGLGLLYAEDLDDGSYDNCNDVYFYVARANPGEPLALLDFYDAAEFNCADAGASHMVFLLVLDFEPGPFDFNIDDDGNQYIDGTRLSTAPFQNHWNTCMVVVEVEDKLPPFLVVPDDASISCEDYYDNIAPFIEDEGFLDAQFGEALFGDNCDVLDSYSFTYDVNQCGEGQIIRTWVVDDAFGNGPISASQVISIFHVSDWDVTFPEDLEANCEDGQLPDFGYPEITGEDCEMIAVSYTDALFNVVPDACYKIIREWSVINWCTYPDEPARTATQVIKVIDNEAPIFSVDDFTVEILEGDCDTAVDLPTPDVTDCSDDITITITSDLPEGEAGPGIYTAEYQVGDGCGNYAFEVITITVVDGKKPTPYLTDQLNVELMQTGMISVNVYDYDIGSFDNCSDVVLSFSPDIEDTDRVYTCDEGPGLYTLEVWVTDEAGNQDFATVLLDVQDNMNACDGAPVLAAGAINTEGSDGVQDVMVDVNAGLFYDMTDIEGAFGFDLSSGGDYSFVPVLDENADNGVTTFDIVLITRHILGIDLLDNAYQMIAADANNSQSVSTLDIVAIRKVILQLEDGFPNNTSWRFVDADHAFANPLSPWGFPEVINFNNMNDDDDAIDFIGVKIGDVNGSAQANLMSPAEQRTGSMVYFTAESTNLKAGQTATVVLESQDKLSGFQFTLDYNNLELVSVDNGIIKEENIGYHDGALTISWNDAAKKDLNGDQLITLQFLATTDVNLSENLVINSRITKAEAYAGNVISDLSLNFASEAGEAYMLYQNEPNPTKGLTEIGFYLPQDGKATLSIKDLSGNTIKVIERDYSKGYNSEIISDLNVSGVLYYTLESGDFTATKKMIILE